MKNSKAYLRLAAFPAIILFLEVALHILCGQSLRYIGFVFFFSISCGALLTTVCALFGKKGYSIVFKILAVVISLVFCAEYVLHSIFTVFYGFSSIATAAGNHLATFIGEAMRVVLKCLPGIIILFIPAVLAIIFVGKKSRSKGRGKRKQIKNNGVIILSAVLAVITYIIAVVLVHLPSKADVTPKSLYRTDTAINEQVEEFGLMTTLRLDLKYMIFPPKGSGEFVEPGKIDERPEDDEDVQYAYNTMNFDFDAMLNGSSKKDVQWLTKYFSSNAATKQNEYTGSMKGYNVIFLTLEGMSGYGISEEFTPTLWKLTHECFVFNNFYTALHFTSTSNGECQNLLSLYPKNGQPVTMTRTGELKTNCYFSLAQQLNRLGYNSVAYHNNQYDLYGRNVSHNNLGYHYVYGAKGTEGRFLVDGQSWPQKDSYMIDASVEKYVSESKPFNVYYITISGHTPYGWNYANKEYKERIQSSASAANYSNATQGYIGTCIEVDKALEHLIADLDAAGQLDNTLIVAAPDHIPYGSVEILEELAGKKFGTSEALSAINESAIDFDVYKSCLIMWNSKMAQEGKTVYVNKPCCQVDILPTISNLLGLEYDSRMLSGSDILSDSDGLVVFSSRSWRSSKGFYNRFTQTFTPVHGEFASQQEIDEYVATMKNIAANKLDCTSKIVENNFYDYALKYRK